MYSISFSFTLYKCRKASFLAYTLTQENTIEIFFNSKLKRVKEPIALPLQSCSDIFVIAEVKQLNLDTKNSLQKWNIEYCSKSWLVIKTCEFLLDKYDQVITFTIIRNCCVIRTGFFSIFEKLKPQKAQRAKKLRGFL